MGLIDKFTPSYFGLKPDPEGVSVNIGGNQYNGFTSVKIIRSINSIADSFSISSHDKWRDSGEAWAVQPNAEITISIGTELVLTGYIDKIDAQANNQNRSITFMGRDLAGDLVDCSAIPVSGKTVFKDISLEDLTYELVSDFGLAVKVEADTGDLFKNFTIKPGEKIFQVLNRAANMRGVLFQTSPDGFLIISNRGGENIQAGANLASRFDIAQQALSLDASLESTSSELVAGENILSASATYDETKRHQEYFVIGQELGGDEISLEDLAGVEGKASDPNARNARRLVLRSESSASPGTAEKRALWEASKRAAESRRISVTVQGWIQPNGDLWKPNILVPVKAPFVGLQSETLLLTQVELNKTVGGGTTATLQLTDPQAFKLNPVGKNEGELGWYPDVYKGVIRKVGGR